MKNPLFRLELLPNHALFRFLCVLPPEKVESLLMTVYGDPGRVEGLKFEEALPFSVPYFWCLSFSPRMERRERRRRTDEGRFFSTMGEVAGER